MSLMSSECRAPEICNCFSFFFLPPLDYSKPIVKLIYKYHIAIGCPPSTIKIIVQLVLPFLLALLNVDSFRVEV